MSSMKKIVGIVVLFIVVFSVFIYVGSFMKESNKLDDEDKKLYDETEKKFNVFIDETEENKGVLEKLRDKLNPDAGFVQALAFGFLYVLEFIALMIDILYLIYSIPSFFLIIFNINHPLFLQLFNIISWLTLVGIYFAIKKEI